MATFYLDYENGNNANDGSSWALAWKDTTAGATAARIAPEDIIRIARSPAPVSLGTTGVWTNLSKTVTLGAAQTATIDLAEVVWTAIAGGDTTVALTPVATDAKEGANCIKLTLDAAPQASVGQAYYATGTLDLSAYQKISFWIKNEAAIADATTWIVNLCSDTAGATPVDTFVIPAIPSTARWIPLTIARTGGGNLGSAIQSIAIYSGATAPTASKFIYVDDFIACTTNGLNLQSLISKNSAEQGGTEGWYGIQSINGVTVLLDTDTNTKANAGRGYSGTTETVTTYKRETIKTAMAAASTTAVQQVMDSGTVGSNIEFQGGFDTSTSLQTGETFFDGLNGNGQGIYLNGKNYTTLNFLNVCRYNTGVYYFNSASNNTITTLSNANNNSTNGIYYENSSNNSITTLSNVNNNGNFGVYYYIPSNNNSIITLSNVNNNGNTGVASYIGNNNRIITLSNANNNSDCGVRYSYSYNNYIGSLSTTGNGTSGIFNNIGTNYINNALIAETTEILGNIAFTNSRIFSNKHDQTANNHWVFTDGGTINSLATDRPGGTGIMWKLAITSANRHSGYPLNLSIAKIAVTANNLVTVKTHMKKDHATNVVGKLVCKGGQIAGVASDVTATKANDINWEELTITFTPTEAGVVEIEAWGYYSADISNVYVEDMTITQA